MRPPPRTLDRLSLRAIVQLLIEKVGPVHAIYLGQKAAVVQDEITQTLLPSIESAARLSLLQARQMARFQSFLLTGEGSYRLAYGAAIPDEDSLYTTLSERVRVMDFDVRERLAQLSGESTRWHFDNQAAFAHIASPSVSIQAIPSHVSFPCGLITGLLKVFARTLEFPSRGSQCCISMASRGALACVAPHHTVSHQT